MAEDEEHDDGLGGRSRRRREITEANRWGRRLLQLDDAQIDALGLDDALRDAIVEGRRVRGPAATNRHVAYVDRLVRELDPDTVARIDAFLQRPPDARSARLNEWSRRLVGEGDAAVSAFVAQWPDVDVTRLRQLVRNARKETTPARGQAALERYLAELGL